MTIYILPKNEKKIQNFRKKIFFETKKTHGECAVHTKKIILVQILHPQTNSTRRQRANMFIYKTTFLRFFDRISV